MLVASYVARISARDGTAVSTGTGVAASISVSEATLASPTPQPDASAAVSEIMSVAIVTCLKFMVSVIDFSVSVIVKYNTILV